MRAFAWLIISCVCVALLFAATPVPATFTGPYPVRSVPGIELENVAVDELGFLLVQFRSEETSPQGIQTVNFPVMQLSISGFFQPFTGFGWTDNLLDQTLEIGEVKRVWRDANDQPTMQAYRTTGGPVHTGTRSGGDYLVYGTGLQQLWKPINTRNMDTFFTQDETLYFGIFEAPSGHISFFRVHGYITDDYRELTLYDRATDTECNTSESLVLNYRLVLGPRHDSKSPVLLELDEAGTLYEYDSSENSLARNALVTVSLPPYAGDRELLGGAKLEDRVVALITDNNNVLAIDSTSSAATDLQIQTNYLIVQPIIASDGTFIAVCEKSIIEYRADVGWSTRELMLPNGSALVERALLDTRDVEMPIVAYQITNPNSLFVERRENSQWISEQIPGSAGHELIDFGTVAGGSTVIVTKQAGQFHYFTNGTPHVARTTQWMVR